ncbi:putative ribonuclease H-like domain-containing protein [Tanacetum coccineum]
MNVAQPKMTSFVKTAHSKRPFERKIAVKNQIWVPKVPTGRTKTPTDGLKFPTAKPTVAADLGSKGKAVKASARWIWKHKQNTTNQGSNFNGVSGKPQDNIDDKGYWDSGCSRHMTGNICYLSKYEPYDGGYVSFGYGGGKITGKDIIKIGKLEFENVYFVKELKYNLTPRQHNMSSIDLNNIVPHKNLSCLVAKASVDESMLWHRRLGHLNFKYMNKLVRNNLVRGLPSKSFENDHSCVDFLKGKQHKASCKTKLVSSVSKPLHTLHMDLFRPTSVSSLNHKWYCLVVTDDFSRCDNGGEFKNREMDEFCTKKGIKGEFSNARTPQQNGVTERRNRTLIEAAMTMLADAKLLVTFWAEAVSTACYVQNRVLVNKSQNKTPYELFNGRSPAIGFLKPFGCHVMIFNTLDHLGKFDAKGDEGTSSTNISGTKEYANQAVKENVNSEVNDDTPKEQDSNADVPEGSGNTNPTTTTKDPSVDQVEAVLSPTVETKVPTVSSSVPINCLSNPPVSSSGPRIILRGGSSYPEAPSLGNAMTFEDRLEDFFRDTTNPASLNEVEADLSNMETNIQVSPIAENKEDFIDKPLYSRFSKIDSFKGVPQPLTGDYTPKPQQEIDESLYVYGKKGPQKPETSVSDDTFSENSITTNEKVVSEPKPTEVEPSCVTHVKTPRQPMKNQGTPKVNGKNWNEMMKRELGEGYSFIKKKCFVCGSLSHLIRNCDFYEKKMAREAELKKQRVFNTGNGVAKPVWNNANRVNHANHFVPRPVQLIAVRQNVNSVRPNVNTGRANVNSVRQNVNSVRSNVNTGSFNINTVKAKQPINTSNSNSFSPVRPQVNKFNQRSNFSKSHSPVRRPIVRNTAKMSYTHAVKGNWGTAVKTSAGYNWRKTRPNSNCNSGSNFIRTDHPLKNMEDRGIFDSGCSGHMTGNKDHLDDFEECKGGSVTFGGSKGYITGKGRIRVGNLDFDSVSFVKELGHFNLFSISQICDKQHKVLFTETECLVVSPDFKMPDENQILLKVPRQHNMYSFDMKTPALTKDYACLIAKATSDESKLWHRRLGHINFKNLNKLVKGNLVRGLPSKVLFLDNCFINVSPATKVTPKTSHLNAVKRIFKYLKGKPNLGLWYPKESSFDLEAFLDSDYAGANLDRKSTTSSLLLILQVGFLKKPEESAGFAEIVDFLKGSLIRYALTHNPTIHDSLVKQFWQTATASTLADGTLELRATIDTLEGKIFDSRIPPSYGSHFDHKEVKKLENILKEEILVLTTSEDKDQRIRGEKSATTTLKQLKLCQRLLLRGQNQLIRVKDNDERKEFKGKDFEDISTGFEEVNTGGLVNTSGLGFSTSSRPVISDRGQREGKAQMIVEETQTPKRIKNKFNKKKLVL